MYIQYISFFQDDMCEILRPGQSSFFFLIFFMTGDTKSLFGMTLPSSGSPEIGNPVPALLVISFVLLEEGKKERRIECVMWVE